MLKKRKIVKAFGVAFDPDEYIGAIERQYYITLLKYGIDYLKDISDPYDLLIPYIEETIGSNALVKKLGKMPVESWLSPKPDLEDEELVNAENYSAFIDADGCREYADLVEKFVQEILDEDSLPLMVGIDHSLSGGVIRALSKRYGAENLSVIVLDSHLDAIQTSIRYKLFNSIKKRGHNLFLPDEFYLSAGLYDPLIFERPDSYNKGTFLYYLIKERILPPRNLWVIGVQDHPKEDQSKINDPYIKEYLNAYLNLENEGVNIITKEKLETKNLIHELDAISTQLLYFSFDVDVGCGSSITLTRCLPDENGLNEHELYNLAETIRRVIYKKEIDLVGLDIMEVDIHYLRPDDNTPLIIAKTLKHLLLE